jgi:hypothetical protein
MSPARKKTDLTFLGATVSATLQYQDQSLAVAVGTEVGNRPAPTLIRLAPTADIHCRVPRSRSLGNPTARTAHPRLTSPAGEVATGVFSTHSAPRQGRRENEFVLDRRPA